MKLEENNKQLLTNDKCFEIQIVSLQKNTIVDFVLPITVLARKYVGLIQNSRGFCTRLLSSIFERCLFSSHAFSKFISYFAQFQCIQGIFHGLGIPSKYTVL